MLLLVASVKQFLENFCNIGKLQDPSTAHLILDVVAMWDTEQCGWKTRSCSL